MVIQVVDQKGNPYKEGDQVMTWEDVAAKYNLELISAEPPVGATVFRLSRLIYHEGAMNWRHKIVDENGAPVAGIAVLMGWTDGAELPADAAPRISPTVWAQPAGKPNRHNKIANQFTNQDGWVEWTLGPGEWYDFAAGHQSDHWSWVMPGDEQWFSDVVLGSAGWWAEHDKFWLEFTMTTEGDTEPEPEPEPGDIVIQVQAEIVIKGL